MAKELADKTPEERLRLEKDKLKAFFASLNGAAASAIVYSIVEICK